MGGALHTVVTTVGREPSGWSWTTRHAAHERKLAAEHPAFAPEDDALFRAGSGAPHRELRPGRIWQFGWPD